MFRTLFGSKLLHLRVKPVSRRRVPGRDRIAISRARRQLYRLVGAGPADQTGDNNAVCDRAFAARYLARPPTHILFYLFLILMSNINIITILIHIAHILPMNVIILCLIRIV